MLGGGGGVTLQSSFLVIIIIPDFKGNLTYSETDESFSCKRHKNIK